MLCSCPLSYVYQFLFHFIPLYSQTALQTMCICFRLICFLYLYYKYCLTDSAKSDNATLTLLVISSRLTVFSDASIPQPLDVQRRVANERWACGPKAMFLHFVRSRLIMCTKVVINQMFKCLFVLCRVHIPWRPYYGALTWIGTVLWILLRQTVGYSCHPTLGSHRY